MRRVEKSQKQWDSIYTDQEREWVESRAFKYKESKQVDPVDEGLSKQLTGFDHCLCLRRRPWCNVGQSPGSFKLQWRTDEEREKWKFRCFWGGAKQFTSDTLNTKRPSDILWKGLSNAFPQDSLRVARTDLYKNFLKSTQTYHFESDMKTKASFQFESVHCNTVFQQLLSHAFSWFVQSYKIRRTRILNDFIDIAGMVFHLCIR